MRCHSSFWNFYDDQNILFNSIYSHIIFYFIFETAKSKSKQTPGIILTKLGQWSTALTICVACNNDIMDAIMNWYHATLYCSELNITIIIRKIHRKYELGLMEWLKHICLLTFFLTKAFYDSDFTSCNLVICTDSKIWSLAIRCMISADKIITIIHHEYFHLKGLHSFSFWCMSPRPSCK